MRGWGESGCELGSHDSLVHCCLGSDSEAGFREGQMGEEGES